MDPDFRPRHLRNLIGLAACAAALVGYLAMRAAEEPGPTGGAVAGKAPVDGVASVRPPARTGPQYVAVEPALLKAKPPPMVAAQMKARTLGGAPPAALTGGGGLPSGPAATPPVTRILGVKNTCVHAAECTLIRGDCGEPLAIPRSQLAVMRRGDRAPGACPEAPAPAAIADCQDGRCRARVVGAKHN